MTFLFDSVTELSLEISSAIVEQAWQQSQSLTTPNGRWNAYLNQIVLDVFLPWLQAEYEPNARVDTNTANLVSFWDSVNGTAINFATKRLIVIPSKTLDTSEFHIPQEWVDIPSWVGDYYLAVQVNPDDLSIRIWGYTTHQQIKTQGSYDSSDRTYCLDASDLIEDLSVLWVVRQLCPDEPTREVVPSLVPLSAIQTENLLQRLANSEIILPRLAISFPLWASLLEQENALQRLYQQRSNFSQQETIPPQRTVNLSQWWQNIFEETWQSMESLLGTEAENLAFSFRTTTEQTQRVIRRVKVINWESSRGSQPVILMVILEEQADSRVAIRVQLRPSNASLYLPTNLRLALLSASLEILQSVEARNQDNVIQLKRFRSPLGTSFSIQVSLEEFSHTEDFVC